MPNSEQEKSQMVEEVKKRSVPRPENAYQAFQDAEGRADYYAEIRDEGESLLKSLDDLKDAFPQSVNELKESAKFCGRDTAEDLKGSLLSLNTRLGYGAENHFKAVYEHVRKIVEQSLPQCCDTLKNQATFDDLDQQFNTGLKAAIADLTTKRQWADG